MEPIKILEKIKIIYTNCIRKMDKKNTYADKVYFKKQKK